jgi:zinc D-Ala-D-Ala dipeptidase
VKKRLKILSFSFILILILCNINFAFAELPKAGLVNLKSYSPHIFIDLKYATTDNFLKQKVYDDPNCYVLETLAKKLDKAQKILEQDGLGLKVFDGYRPLSVQKKMWAIVRTGFPFCCQS